MIPRLPPEILHMIIGCVTDHTELFVLRTCCHLFRNAAERGLFSSMELIPANAFEQRAYCRLLGIIGGTERLARVVKDLRFMDCVSGPAAWNALANAEHNGDHDTNPNPPLPTVTHTTADDNSDCVLDQKYWKALCDTLPHLINLRTLRVHVNENDDTKLSLGWIFSASIPAHPSLRLPFTLHTLAIHFEADDDVLRFLASQPRIKSLQLDFWAPQNEVLPAHALPDLEILTAGTDVLAHILPGRRTVRAVECDYWLDGTFQEGVEPFEHVRALKLRDVRLDPPHFRVFSALFPSLKFLCYCSEPTPAIIELFGKFDRLEHLQIYPDLPLTFPSFVESPPMSVTGSHSIRSPLSDSSSNTSSNSFDSGLDLDWGYISLGSGSLLSSINSDSLFSSISLDPFTPSPSLSLSIHADETSEAMPVPPELSPHTLEPYSIRSQWEDQRKKELEELARSIFSVCGSLRVIEMARWDGAGHRENSEHATDEQTEWSWERVNNGYPAAGRSAALAIAPTRCVVEPNLWLDECWA